jgi:hypothetical protein
MKVVNAIVGSTSMVAWVPGLLSAIELQPVTVKAWDEYVRSADLRMQTRLGGQRSFLWTDESPGRKLRIRRGEILVAPVVGYGTQNVPE